MLDVTPRNLGARRDVAREAGFSSPGARDPGAESGIALIAVMAASSLLLALGLSLALTTTVEIDIAANQRDGVQTLHAADAAARAGDRGAGRRCDWDAVLAGVAVVVLRRRWRRRGHACLTARRLNVGEETQSPAVRGGRLRRRRYGPHHGRTPLGAQQSALDRFCVGHRWAAWCLMPSLRACGLRGGLGGGRPVGERRPAAARRRAARGRGCAPTRPTLAAVRCGCTRGAYGPSGARRAVEADRGTGRASGRATQLRLRVWREMHVNCRDADGGPTAERQAASHEDHVPSPSSTQVLVVAVALAAVLTSGAPAQSLGEVARQEEARRKGTARGRPAGKVYTNEELQADAPAAGQRAAPSPSAASAVHAVDRRHARRRRPTPRKPDRPSPAATQRRGDEADVAQRAPDRAATRSSRVQDLRRRAAEPHQRPHHRLHRARRSGTAGHGRRPIGRRRSTELERVKKEIQQHTKALADIQEEAPQGGVPPGWLR